MRLGREAENPCQITSELGAEMMFSVSLPEMRHVAEERNLRWAEQRHLHLGLSWVECSTCSKL